MVTEELSFCPYSPFHISSVLPKKILQNWGEKKKKKSSARISFLDCTMHICNITLSFEGSGNPISLGFKSAAPSFCLTEAQNCLFIGLFIIRMSAAEGESIQKTFQLQFCSEDTRRYLTHLNIIKIIGHRIQERSE